MRLFIGLSISDEARAALARTTERINITRDGRYARTDMYHITLAFLGEVDSGRVKDVIAAMEVASARARPIELTLSVPGTFGRNDDAILYVGVEGAEGLRCVANDLRHALAARDLPYDPKPFKAHITLVRHVKEAKDLFNVKVEPVAFTADRLTLFHSCRTSGELRYLPIGTTPFGKEMW